ncbi:MAG TPA: tetratricopeptide repeat protein, partial [Chthonomonadaceae bacterium]|nr:tetratricopeptide repeat protein [Chthonomonadaceae bacterium]
MIPKPWRIEMLGDLCIKIRDHRSLYPRLGRQSSLLAYLAYHTHHGHTREALVERFWPEMDQESGLTNLRGGLAAVRRMLGAPDLNTEDVLVADRYLVRINPTHLETDVTEFEALIAQGQGAGSDPQAALTRAVEFYKGELLPGYTEDWIEFERLRLTNDHLAALQRLVVLHEKAGEAEAALRYAQRVLQTMPTLEAAHSDVIHLYAQLGRNAEAVKQFGSLERMLRKEYQRRPSPALRDLVQSLRASPDGLVGSLVRETLTITPAPVVRMPKLLTRFFGREGEIAALLERLRPTGDASIRLLTLTGTGGTGKTRLAMEVGKRAAAQLGLSVTFVPLADVSRPALIAPAIRSALCLEPTAHIEPLEQVVQALAEAPSLLILDNFEHLAGGGSATILTLLEQAPGLRLLLTSQRPLRLPGEEILAIPPLPLPETGVAVDHLETVPSVQLYLDRAKAASPSFMLTPQNGEAVADLCRKLEGLPLALELAGARADVLTPAEMLQRLTRRFETLVTAEVPPAHRHSSLWATISWSYDLLPPELQRFFARLSVFRDGFDAFSAEAVCLPQGRKEESDGLEEASGSALNALSHLQSSSLVTPMGGGTPMRFHVLETLREFAAEQLSAEEAEEAALCHAERFMRLAEQADPHLEGADQFAWTRRLESDKENLRAALTWCDARPERAGLELRIARCLALFWRRGGYLREGREWLERALEHPSEGYEQLLTKALNGLGALAWEMGDYDTAERRYTECLELSRKQGKQGNLAGSLINLALVAKDRGDVPKMQQMLRESIAAYRVLGREDRVGDALANLGAAHMEQNDYAAAEPLLKESLEILERARDLATMASTLGNLGELACIQGDAAAGRTYLERALELDIEGQLRLDTINTLFWLGQTLFLEGEVRRAVRVCGAAEALREQAG